MTIQTFLVCLPSNQSEKSKSCCQVKLHARPSSLVSENIINPEISPGVGEGGGVIIGHVVI